MFTLVKYMLLFGLLISLPVISSRLIQHAAPVPKIPAAKPQPKNLAADYISLKDSLKTEREKLATQYKNAATEAEKQIILKQAKNLFLNTLENRIIPAWYGTPWDFYGTTETPNNGYIACGYFVSTVLRDADVKLDRVHLAEIESETMIRTVIDKKYISRYRATDFDTFINTIRKAGDALYMVGLDSHTGFLLCRNGQTYFLHSYIPGVIKEPTQNSYWLKISYYRVTGKISHDPVFLRKWLTGANFPNITAKK